jgi:methylated-DNA-[protein]-cysteine S-methyltransferase
MGAAAVPVSRTGVGLEPGRQQHAPVGQQQRWAPAHDGPVEHGTAAAAMPSESASAMSDFTEALISQHPAPVKHGERAPMVSRTRRWGDIMSSLLGVDMPRHTATVCFTSPLGLLEVEAAADGVTKVRLGARGKQREVGDGNALELARRARVEIVAFLSGEARSFTVPVATDGTAFQRAVWHRLQQIPFGTRRTYGEIARALGKPRAARAVGMACRANPTPLLVPCHRVVTGNGALGGFSGGATMKRRLLELEES